VKQLFYFLWGCSMTQDCLPASNVRCVPSRRAIAGIATISIFVLLLGLALGWVFTGRASLAQPIKTGPQNLIVRGYLAAAVGQSNEAERSGLFSSAIAGKDIHLPGIDVFLADPQRSKASKSAKTDLSGRFTLHAPDRGRYLICWRSAIYGDDCDVNFVSVGVAPQFVSTIRIRIPHQPDHVAVMGHVTMGDGALPRTFEPLLNINAFATVNLEDEKGGQIAAAYVNNFGDYLLPHVPVKTKVRLTAGIESARFTQEIWPEARIEVAPLHQVNLKFENRRPRLDPLVAFDAGSNRRVQNAVPGSTINVVAEARDSDGDPVKFAWFLDSADGMLSAASGSTAQWKLPAARGRFAVTVVAYDGKGGYDKAVFSVHSDERGVPFTGSVVTPAGAPVANAAIEIVGNAPVTTDAGGRFQTYVKEADRYVLNIRKEGFALNSRAYDRGVTGGRWILRPAQVLTIDPTRNATVTHQRTERDCLGPESARAGLGAAGQSLTIPQWQDGKGNVTDPPSWWNGPRSVAQLGRAGAVRRAADQRERQPVILSRDLKLPGCGPGITVEIPANSILDASGKPATAPIKVAVATVDLLSSQQMPGDDTVVPTGGGGAYLKSYGAGSLDLPSGFRLRPGASARITIPVDRSRLLAGALPATVPLLSYNEQTGLWEEEDKLTMTVRNGVRSYTGSVRHFTTYNADTFLNNGACLRLFSPSLPGSYNLEVMSPFPDGTPHYKNYPIDNVTHQEHVIFNITPKANITLAPMTSGSNPQLLGFYIVNSGDPEDPPHLPPAPSGPPYISCKNFVVLTIDNAPDSPFGGEFLHGLGFLDAANLGFDDLTTAGPTGNALRDAIVAASKAYYTQVDPPDPNSNSNRDTFAKFKSKNGFDPNPNVPVAGEFVAQYANSGDLGFGRDMHCLKKGNGDVACYVTNYGTGYTSVAPGGGTADQDDANAAGQRNTVGFSKELATVAMEYSPIENDPAGDKVVKFFVYKKDFPNSGDYNRSISANLDGRGERPVPQLCMTCHGGLLPQQSSGVAVFSTADDAKLGSRFLPFDHRFFTFPSDPALSKANQELSIKNLNEQIVNAAPPTSAGDAIGEVINGMYNNGASAKQISNFAVPGWATGASANAPNQQSFYQGVLTPACRTCHVAQSFAQLQFNTSDKFVNLSVGSTSNNKLMLGAAQSRVCGDYVMPHALRTHDIFWNVYWDALNWGPPPSTAFHIQFQNFGNGVGGSTWKLGLCTSFISGTATSPSLFYQHTVQPIWNGRCVGCHIGTSAPQGLHLTEGLSFDDLVPPGDARVVPFDDNPATAGNILLQWITGTAADRMPPGCFRAPEPPNGLLPCLDQTDIDNIKAWIRSGAN
jgi:hypothetical protein